MNNSTVEELLLDFKPFPALSWSEAISYLSEKSKTNNRIPSDLDKLKLSGKQDWKEVGRLINIAGDYSMSQRAYYNGFNPSVKNQDLLNGLVYTFRQCKQNAEAIALYTARFQDNPSDLSTLEKLANLHFETGRYLEAAKFYDKFLQLSPGDENKKRMLHTAKKLIKQAIKQIDASEEKAQLQEVRECLVAAGNADEGKAGSFKNTVLAVTLAAAIISALADSKEAYNNASVYISSVYGALSEQLNPILEKWEISKR